MEWHGEAKGPTLLATGAIQAAAGVVALVFSLTVLGVVLIMSSLLVLTLAHDRVRIDATHLHVRGWLPLPSLRLPVDQVESVEVVDLEPMRWGGWGYRGSLRAFGKAAWVVRSGPGIVLHLTRGRTFAVTVDGAEDAAEVIRSRIAGR
jgi:hypothetical protein